MSLSSSRFALAAFGLVMGLLMTGCAGQPQASEQAAPVSDRPTAAVDTKAVGTVIDVRTPEEFAEGHLEGAVNIDFNASTFSDEIAKLDKNGTYTVYCRSGNRSAQAVEQMKASGFSSVTDAGGIQDAAQSLGLPTVKS